MLVESECGKAEFQPVYLGITLETQQEVDQFHNIFNCGHVLDATCDGESGNRVIEGIKIRDCLEPYITAGPFDQDAWKCFLSQLRKSLTRDVQ